MGKFFSGLAGLALFGAISSSSHFQLQSFSLNSGGTTGPADSSSHQLVATLGEQTGALAAGINKFYTSGLVYALSTDVPNPPTVSNGGGTYYNKLKFTINNSNEPSDVSYAVGVNTDGSISNFSFVQSDGALGVSRYYQNYTGWGGASGSVATNLNPGTTYYFSVFAKQSTFGAPISNSNLASIATVNPSLSFSLNPSSIDLGNLNAGVLVTDSSLAVNFLTNAYNGAQVFLAGSSTGLVSTTNGNYTINVTPPSQDLDSLSEGFGARVGATTGSSYAEGSYAQFGGGNVVGAIYTTFSPIFGLNFPGAGGGQVILQAKTSTTTPSGSDYTETLTFVAAASY